MESKAIRLTLWRSGNPQEFVARTARASGMTSIVELYPKARRLTFDIQTQLQYVERGHSSPEDAGIRLEELGRQLKVLDGLVGQERPAQREGWRRWAFGRIKRSRLLNRGTSSTREKRLNSTWVTFVLTQSQMECTLCGPSSK